MASGVKVLKATPITLYDVDIGKIIYRVLKNIVGASLSVVPKVLAILLYWFSAWPRIENLTAKSSFLTSITPS